jgi:Flp pilus assembly protein protease CpaA
MRGTTVNNLATARSKAESLMPATVLGPSILVVNTFALFALNWVGGIPNWIKTVAALFLSF